MYMRVCVRRFPCGYLSFLPPIATNISPLPCDGNKLVCFSQGGVGVWWLVGFVGGGWGWWCMVVHFSGIVKVGVTFIIYYLTSLTLFLQPPECEA